MDGKRKASGGYEDDCADSDPQGGDSVDEARIERLLRKAETILSQRTDRILLVLERPYITDNYLGCLRTAECLGIQSVWIVVEQRQHHKTEAPPPPAEGSKKAELKDYRRRVRLSRSSAQWLDVREFATTSECISELKREGWEIWTTDLSEASVNLLSHQDLELPPKVAVVMGRESDGVTEEMISAASRRFYLPLFGFNTSLNLQVATGMVLQRLLSMCPSARGDLSHERRASIRKDWYIKLARSEAQKGAFLAHLDSPPPPYEDVRQIYSGPGRS